LFGGGHIFVGGGGGRGLAVAVEVVRVGGRDVTGV